MRIVLTLLLCALAAGGGTALFAGLAALGLGLAGGELEVAGSVGFTLIIWIPTASIPLGLTTSVVAVPRGHSCCSPRPEP